jgi:hypothetical protein
LPVSKLMVLPPLSSTLTWWASGFMVFLLSGEQPPAPGRRRY